MPFDSSATADDRHEQRDIFGEQAPASFGDSNVCLRPVLRIAYMDGWVLSAKILEEIANSHHDLTTSRLIQSLHRPARVPTAAP